jgi:hypothetical protein
MAEGLLPSMAALVGADGDICEAGRPDGGGEKGFAACGGKGCAKAAGGDAPELRKGAAKAPGAIEGRLLLNTVTLAGSDANIWVGIGPDGGGEKGFAASVGKGCSGAAVGGTPELREGAAKAPGAEDERSDGGW